MTMKSISDQERESKRSGRAQSPLGDVVDQLAGLLPAGAFEDALKGFSPSRSRVLADCRRRCGSRNPAALGAELSEHLGYPPGQAPPGKAANHRNGATAKTVQTEIGTVVIKTPRDRVGSF